MAQYLVALSGGSDSVCLLLTLLEKGKVGAAAHCNFQLRGEESERDEQFVRTLCKERGVKLYVKRFNTQDEAKRAGESIEMAARRLRYAWFQQLIDKLQLDAVAVGHHQEDNVETLLLNLTRGTGLTGLLGMQTLSFKQGFPIFRPLLNWNKQQILHYLAKKNQTYITDSTNADTHYRRNKVRHELLPLLQTMNPQVVNTLHQMAQHLTEVQRLCNEGINAVKTRAEFTPLPRLHTKAWSMNWERLQNEPNARTVLHHLLQPWHFNAAQINEALNMRTGALIETSDALLTRTNNAMEFSPRPKYFSPTPLRLPKNGNETICFENENFHLTLEIIPRQELTTLKCPNNVTLLDADKITAPLIVRRIQSADRFQPLGMQGTQLVSDYLTNHHASRLEKLTQLLVCDSQERIVWLVNARSTHPFRVTNTTKRVMRITFHHK